MLIENRVHLVADRHAHLMFLGELEDEFGGVNAFDDLADFLAGFIAIEALAQHDAETQIAGLGVGAGENQIAEAG